MERTLSWLATPALPGVVAGWYVVRYSQVRAAWWVARHNAPNPDEDGAAASAYDFSADPLGLRLPAGASSFVDRQGEITDVYQVLGVLENGAMVPVDTSVPDTFKAKNIASGDHRVVVPGRFECLDVVWKQESDEITLGDDNMEGEAFWHYLDAGVDRWGAVSSSGGRFTFNPGDLSAWTTYPPQAWWKDDNVGSDYNWNGVIAVAPRVRENSLAMGCMVTKPYLQGSNPRPPDPFFSAPPKLGKLFGMLNTTWWGGGWYDDCRVMLSYHGVGVGVISEAIGTTSAAYSRWQWGNFSDGYTYRTTGDEAHPRTPTLADQSPGSTGWGEIRGYTHLGQQNSFGLPPTAKYQFNPATGEPLFTLDPSAWDWSSWKYRELNATGKSASDITAADNAWRVAVLAFNPPPEMAWPDMIWRLRVIRAR